MLCFCFPRLSLDKDLTSLESSLEQDLTSLDYCADRQSGVYKKYL